MYIPSASPEYPCSTNTGGAPSDKGSLSHVTGEQTEEFCENAKDAPQCDRRSFDAKQDSSFLYHSEAESVSSDKTSGYDILLNMSLT